MVRNPSPLHDFSLSASNNARYVLSPTHLHEFKSADKAQAPVMSLYLPEQKLGSHSQEGTASQKFILKGRQTGGMHRGHTWVFRAESHDTMMAWYADLKVLTERTPQQRSELFGLAARSGSRASRRSNSSDARAVDEEDEEPFAAREAVDVSVRDGAARRPQAGGRFPSDLQLNAQRGVEVATSPSSGSSGVANGTVNFAGGDPRDAGPVYDAGYGAHGNPVPAEEPSHVAVAHQARDNPYANEGLYHPAPIHGAPVTTIYQYQTPSRGNSYADGADGARRGSQGQDGLYPQGQGGVSHEVPGPSSYQEASPYQPTPADGGQQKEYTAPSTEASTAAGASATSTGDDTVTGGERNIEEAPAQGVSRASTFESMHIPGDFPKSAANIPGGDAAGKN